MDVSKEDWCVYTMHFCCNGKYIFMINKETVEAIVLCWGFVDGCSPEYWKDAINTLDTLLNQDVTLQCNQTASLFQSWNSAAVKGDVVVVIFGPGIFL